MSNSSRCLYNKGTLICSSQSRFGPMEDVLWHLFRSMLIQSLNETLYYPVLVGFKSIYWEVTMTEQGLHITSSTYNQTLPVLMEKLISKITNFSHDVNEEIFEIARKEYIQNEKTRMIEHHTFIQYIQKERSWTVDDLLNAAKMLRFDRMKNFLSKVFRRVFLQAFIYGNCTEKKAMEIVRTLEKSFSTSHGMLLQEVLHSRYMEIADGSHFIYQVFNEEPNMFGYAAYFQLHTESCVFKDVIMTYALHEIIRKSQLEILPNRSQNTYQSFKFILISTHGLNGVVIKVRTEKDPRYMDSKMEKYLQNVSNVLKSTKNEQFQSIKESASIKPSYSAELCGKYWREISSRYYNFDRIQMEVEQLRSLKMADVLSFFKKMLDISSSRRRKMVVNIFPKRFTRNTQRIRNHVPAGATIIDNLHVLSTTSVLLPIISVQKLPSSIRK